MKIVFILFLCFYPVFLSSQSMPASSKVADDIPDIQCKVRLPNSINSYRPTIQPVLTPDGSRLYFDRKFHPNNTASVRDCDDIWYANRLPNGSWSEPINIGQPLNTRGCDVLFSISPDGNSALVGGVYPETQGGEKMSGFSITTWDGTSWSTPVPIQIPGFYNNSGFFYASLSSDAKVLLFGISQKDCLGELDLYISLKDKSGSWSEPHTLGPTVNSPYMEVSPFLALDGKTLYFASSRPGGFGKSDIYVTKRLDDTWTRWSQPKNLGLTINTFADELSITINAAGDTACIVSADSMNQLEGIYFVCLPKDVRPQKVNLQQFIQEIRQDTAATLQLYFASGENTISDRNETIIKNHLRAHPSFTSARVVGYTDDIGTDESNITLSQKRARTAGSLLKSMGIRMKDIQWKGETDLTGKEINEADRWKYRKIEITFSED